MSLRNVDLSKCSWTVERQGLKVWSESNKAKDWKLIKFMNSCSKQFFFFVKLLRRKCFKKSLRLYYVGHYYISFLLYILLWSCKWDFQSIRICIYLIIVEINQQVGSSFFSQKTCYSWKKITYFSQENSYWAKNSL